MRIGRTIGERDRNSQGTGSLGGSKTKPAGSGGGAGRTAGKLSSHNIDF